jgi:hypothetical protein
MHKRIGVSFLLVGLLFFSSVQILMGEELPPDVPNAQTRAIIELLKEKGIINESEAAEFIERLNGKRQAEGTQAPTTPPIDEQKPEKSAQKEVEDLQKDVQKADDAIVNRQRLLERRVDDLESGTIDSLLNRAVKSQWAQRISLKGDIRLRYQSDKFADGNQIFVRPDDTEQLLNTTEDRDRYRYRARLGMKAKLIDYREANVGKVEAGMRLTTGNETDPVSTNDTLGDTFNRDSTVFDRAYLNWSFKPTDTVWGRMPKLSIVGGRFANPWFSTDLVWDSDLNFEGAAINYLTDTQQLRPFNMFATAGIFPLQEEEFSNRDKWLWGAQIGFDYKPRFDIAFTLGAAYYDYNEIEGIQNDLTQPGVFDFTAPQFQQKGNTLMDIDPSSSYKLALATDYNILDLYLKTNLGLFHPIQILLDTQYVRNLGFDRDRVAEVTGNDDPVEDIDGYMVGLTVGYPEIVDFREWNIGFRYKYLGADAVPDAFTDSDFHLGGTNAKGWILKGEYGLYRNVWLTTRWLSADEIEGPKLGVDTLQVDINSRF